MNLYREYFIGGPLHGQDRRERFPEHPEWHPIRVDDTENGMEVYADGGLLPIHILYGMWNYYPQTHWLGGQKVVLWTDAAKISREVIALAFWEIILEPHKTIVKENEVEGVAP